MPESEPTRPNNAHPDLTRLERFILAMLLATLLSISLTGTSFFNRASLGLQDVQMVFLAKPVQFEHTLVVDVDEDSMATLADSLGAWPYDREIFALMVAYLKNAGARAVVFDVLFAEARKGDREFARAIEAAAAANGTGGTGFGVVLGAAVLPNDITRRLDYHADLRRLSWLNIEHTGGKTGNTPQRSWRDITLPAPDILRQAPAAQAGVMTVAPDAEDGHVRRIPLLHEAYGNRLPSLPLAAVFAAQAQKPQIKWNDHRTQFYVGQHRWPINAQGEVALHFGKGVHAVPALPFHEVMAAALGVSGYEAVRAAVAGKTVFVGSSASRLGDFVQTPVGRTRGLYLAAMTHEMLATDRVLAPPSFLWNGLLLLLALSVPVAAYLSRVGNTAAFAWLSAPVAAALVLGASSLLLLTGQQTDVMFALTMAMMALLMQFLQRMGFLYRNQQRLKLEKIAAENAAELKKQFIAQMTHELRTPLTAVLGYNRLLADRDITPSERKRYTGVVEKSGQHLLTLINDMLDQAKIEAGQMSVVLAPTDVRRVVDDAVEGLQAIAGEKALSLRAEFDANVPDGKTRGLMLDGFRLKQVLINLIGNGIKFTERGGVTVRVSWADEKLKLAVTDTGKGMSEEALAKIFVAFQQADDHVASTHGGTGLGLTISQKLTQLMGGEITVLSTLGVGSTFQSAFPASACALEKKTDAPQPGHGNTMPPQTAHHRILVADDSEELLALMDHHLKRMGMITLLAENGQQMVALALAENPALVFTDMEMPLLGGVEATRQLRVAGFTGPIIALTGHTVGPETDRALAAGCNECLQKPVSPERLQAVIQQYLGAGLGAGSEQAGVPSAANI